MNRKRWYEYRRNWRLVSRRLYEEFNGLTYDEQKRIEHHFAAAQYSYATNYGPCDLMYLWERAKHARTYGISATSTRNAMRAYMRTNMKTDGRKKAVQAHPCSWNAYDKVV
jgi:predicted GIY-YIG superfamily endonuclease